MGAARLGRHACGRRRRGRGRARAALAPLALGGARSRDRHSARTRSRARWCRCCRATCRYRRDLLQQALGLATVVFHLRRAERDPALTVAEAGQVRDRIATLRGRPMALTSRQRWPASRRPQRRRATRRRQFRRAAAPPGSRCSGWARLRELALPLGVALAAAVFGGGGRPVLRAIVYAAIGAVIAMVAGCVRWFDDALVGRRRQDPPSHGPAV